VIKSRTVLAWGKDGGIFILGDTKNWTSQSPEQHGIALGLALWGWLARSLPN